MTEPHSSYPKANFTEEELDDIRNIIMAWINDGFTIPPYSDTEYSIFEKLNITEDAVKSEGYYLQYDVSRPSPTTTKVQEVQGVQDER